MNRPDELDQRPGDLPPLGRIAHAGLGQLRLDPFNPRLPDSLRDASQIELAAYIELHYDALIVAESIAQHGFFESEPLIVIQEEAFTQLTVVEGNRRLTAILGLADAGFRQAFHRPRQWTQLAEAARLPVDYPVLRVGSRLEVAPLIGYRHISGILPWDPFAQARYVTQLVDTGRLSFSDAAGVLGEPESNVRAMYRNQAIVAQAHDSFRLDTEPAKSDFGVFTRAMQSVPIRAHIGAPDPRDVRPGEDPLPHERQDEVSEVLLWLFGDEQGNGRAIAESRDIRRLAHVLEAPEAVEVLRATGDLVAAEEAVGGTLSRLLSRLVVARKNLDAATQDIDAHPNDRQVLALIAECEGALTRLKGDQTVAD